MQTFLPYADYSYSAQCLDNKRLNKQLVEVQQILNTLSNPNAKGWKNHPAVKMWKGHELSLALYGAIIYVEYKKRFNQKQHKSGEYILKEYLKPTSSQVLEYPPWLGNKDFHASHRSNLLRKDKKWYGQFGWKEPDNLPYIWPC